MSKDCKDTLQTLKTVTKRACDAKWEQSICQMRSWAELSRSGKLRVNSSVFNWRLKDASEDNDVRDLDRLFHVRAAATVKSQSSALKQCFERSAPTFYDDVRNPEFSNTKKSVMFDQSLPCLAYTFVLQHRSHCQFVTSREWILTPTSSHTLRLQPPLALRGSYPLLVHRMSSLYEYPSYC